MVSFKTDKWCRLAAVSVLLAVGMVLQLKADELTAWRYRAKITFSGYSGSDILTNFPALVVLSESNIEGFSYVDCLPDGADIRFSDSGGNVIPYESDTWDPEGVHWSGCGCRNWCRKRAISGYGGVNP